MATTASSSLPRNYSFTTPRPSSFIRGPPLARTLPLYLRRNRRVALTYRLDQNSKQRSGGNVRCEATEVSSSSSVSTPGRNWVPVVPLSALPKGERRVVIQDDETILLLWYKNDVFAIENRSPAEGAYSEGLLNARLTQDGCIVCPSTDSTFDLRTGEIREWYPKNPVLRVLTPALRKLFVYPVKYDEENIYISIRDSGKTEAAAEIVFSGKAQPGLTATNVNVDEVRMIVDEGSEGFGFTKKNEVINGKAAVIGFLLLLDFELLTGKGLLKGTGFLDFLYSASDAFK
ncbi:unnamed protein product [Arabidopsis thaliana]|uniref:Rieske (2Fe-2S) domain-containing protein n=2 Tax=Arabidopsis thaliana TaxID=3702 RepID=Q9C9I7_ARATH|nr:Rieske (2Fe-2S) domain-containing protein [Arabidopsis thaliana]AAG51832.1 unknown protein; 39989-38742 [Arabidopsis thaliana]AAM13030.1 unknown protein [Arabidopsis thaliana]AAM64783.1 unknown [Arabidopsis thaliana]AAM91334.1 unknown protein [Arabidopsis thaliana]AEE35208.1 Rieske (2Fe-2S) domain-containing protein [Arabidopsis thaliana]|eukprot:NP_565018.1 Rieske (2Fe-2S) domain-containing protein [Arabidopsis thaliana]